MRRLLLALLLLLLALCASRAPAETLAERYWRLHRERNATTRYGAPPTAATNSLPAGYRLLEYVESTGAQYVDTGFDCSSSHSFKFSICFSLVKRRASTENNYLFSCASTASWLSSEIDRNSPYRIYSNIGTRTLIFCGPSPYPTNSWDTFTITVNPGSMRYSMAGGDWESVGTFTGSLPNGRINLFAARGKGTTSLPFLKMGRIQIWDNGISVRDYVPAKDAAGVAGLWDRVSGTMFYSATSTPLVAGPELRPATVLPTVSRETVREMIAPAPTGEPPELAGGDLWLDCLAIPEGNWLCECPIAGTTNTAWRAALCPSNILRAVVWRHATGVAPTNLPVTLEHDPSRVIGRIERLFYEAGTGVVARISVTQAGYAWAVSNHCAKPSPDVRAMYTNLVVRTDGWIHEHQDYIDARCVPSGEDMSSVTNVPSGVQALVMAPVYLRGLSLVSLPLLPTYIEYRVPDNLRDVYPIRPPRQWDWRR